MQNYCKTISALAAASAFAAGSAVAGTTTTYAGPSPVTPAPSELGFDGEIHVGYDTQYNFRGINLGDDLVHAGVDLGTSVGGFDLSVGAWYGVWENNIGFPNGPTIDTDELDIYGEISKDLGFATVAVGYIYYYFPQADVNSLATPIGDAQEAYLSVSKNIFGIDASIAYFWDIETDNDGYTSLSLSKGFELAPSWTLNISAVTGYLVEEGSLGHVTGKVGVDYAISESATLSVYGAHNWTLAEASTSSTSTSFQFGQDNEFFGGAALSVSF